MEVEAGGDGDEVTCRKTRTFHVHTCRTPPVVSHELLDLVVPKYLCSRRLPGHQQQKIPEFLEADRTRVWRRRQEGHEFSQRVGLQ